MSSTDANITMVKGKSEDSVITRIVSNTIRCAGCDDGDIIYNFYDKFYHTLDIPNEIRELFAGMYVQLHNHIHGEIGFDFVKYEVNEIRNPLLFTYILSEDFNVATLENLRAKDYILDMLVARKNDVFELRVLMANVDIKEYFNITNNTVTI